MTLKVRTEVQFEVRNGRTLSKTRDYYENGKLAREGTYANGHGSWNWEIPIGPVKKYHPNGSIKSEEHFDDNGSLDGESRYFDEAGKLLSRTIYIKDKKMSEEYFDKTGKSIPKPLPPKVKLA